jgi:uncharacterized protein (TIGR02246 family)
MNGITKADPLFGFLIAAVCLSLTTDEVLAQSGLHERAIADAYSSWVQTTNAKDLEAWASFLAPGAVFLPPDTPVLADRQAILDFYAELFADSQFSLDCRQERVDVAISEDLAWSFGKCESSFTGPDGRMHHGTSKWMKVWKRQPSGEWKCAANSWNSAVSG